MNLAMEKEIYQRPEAELITIGYPLSLLIGFSASGELGDFEDDGSF